MNKRLLVTVGFLMFFGIFMFQTNPLLASEHGGSTMQEHGGMSMSDESKSGTSASDDATTLKDAAAALKSSNPELAKKLEKMAAKQCGI